MSTTRWSRGVMVLNMALMYPLVLLGAYILWEKTALLFWVYSLTWLGILTVGRYYVCRACRYYGQDCPSFGFSHMARIFDKEESQAFSRHAVIIDTSVIVASLLLPVIVWLFGILTKAVSFSPMDHMVMILYLILFIAMSIIHNVTGCSKCDVSECPMSKGARVI